MPDSPRPRRNRRDELLRAFRGIVLEQGERAATLEAVAAAAEVSKGGLLYHFASREALVAGLCERFAELVEQEIAEVDDGAFAEWYLRTSSECDSELETTMAALMRLAQHHEATVRPALLAARERWFACIRDDVGDDRIAAAVLLLGDGIAYNAEVEGSGGGSRLATPETAAALGRLLRAAGRLS